MKTPLIIFCLMLFSASGLVAQAPSYSAFEWDIIGVGATIPVGDNQLTEGFSFGGEVRFNATDNFSLGLGSDFAFFDTKNLENLDANGDATIGFSYTSFLSGDYYFNTASPNRGFVGLAIGHSDIGDIEITAVDEEATLIEGESGTSLSPRVGYELGHARFLLNYNIGLKKELTDYISIKISMTLWGGYKG